MDHDYVFPGQWSDLRGHAADDAAVRAGLNRELRREVASGHVLAGRPARAMASCWHCDDVLFDLLDGSFARVHLSYPRTGPDRPPWPETEVFDDWAGAVAYVEDHAGLA